MGTDTFDIDANLPSRPTTPRERTLMMRALLEERFALKAHFERREIAVYALVRASSSGTPGARLRPREKCIQEVRSATPERADCAARIFNRPGDFSGEYASLTAFAMYLSEAVDRLVIDRTGLAGRFDFEVRYAPATEAGQMSPRQAVYPSLFTALQEQLGLRLEATRAPIDLLVIDDAQRPRGN